ncbi:MAG: arginase [Treponema sp.]|nr:arginase [Treponema sp.]MBD5409744.1 arginase [Treponema sp.]
MNVHILEMPLDYGGRRHGSDMGPSALRLAGIRQKIEELGHTVVAEQHHSEIIAQEYVDPGKNPKAKYLEPIARACTDLAREVHSVAESGDFPLVLGGDHSIALGTLAGLHSAYKDKRLGVLYIDAHGDFNTTETTVSGNIHGECLAASAGYGIDELVNLYTPGKKVDPENICYVGVRDLDKGEKALMREAGVTVFSISDIDRLGFSEVLKKVKIFFKSRCDVVHVSFDMDSLDPSIAPGTGLPVPGGLNYREALLLMEEMSSLGMVCSMEVVEVNPILDVRNETAVMAVTLIARLLGEKIF